MTKAIQSQKENPKLSNTPSQIKPREHRKWWISSLLSLVVPGLGQMYNAQAEKGLIFFFTYWIIHFIFMTIFLGIHFTPFNFLTVILYILSIIIFYIFIISDAIKTAKNKNYNNEYTLKDYNEWYFYLLVFLIYIFIAKPTLNFMKYTLVKSLRVVFPAACGVIYSRERIYTQES